MVALRIPEPQMALALDAMRMMELQANEHVILYEDEEAGQLQVRDALASPNVSVLWSKDIPKSAYDQRKVYAEAQDMLDTLRRRRVVLAILAACAYAPDTPAWSITEGEGGQVTLNMRGLPFPLTFDAEHWIAFKADVSSI